MHRPFFAHWFPLLLVCLMCGPRRLCFFQCGPETPKGWTAPLDHGEFKGRTMQIPPRGTWEERVLSKPKNNLDPSFFSFQKKENILSRSFSEMVCKFVFKTLRSRICCCVIAFYQEIELSWDLWGQDRSPVTRRSTEHFPVAVRPTSSGPPGRTVGAPRPHRRWETQTHRVL